MEQNVSWIANQFLEQSQIVLLEEEVDLQQEVLVEVLEVHVADMVVDMVVDMVADMEVLLHAVLVEWD